MQCQRCGGAADPGSLSFDEEGLAVCRSCAAQVKIHVAQTEAKGAFQGRLVFGSLAMVFLVAGCGSVPLMPGKLGFFVGAGSFLVALLFTALAVTSRRR
jgi:hypothetical protein